MALHRMPRKGERIHFAESTRQGRALDLIVDHVSSTNVVWCRPADAHPIAATNAPCFIGQFADGTFNTAATNLDEESGS